MIDTGLGHYLYVVEVRRIEFSLLSMLQIYFALIFLAKEFQYFLFLKCLQAFIGSKGSKEVLVVFLA